MTGTNEVGTRPNICGWWRKEITNGHPGRWNTKAGEWVIAVLAGMIQQCCWVSVAGSEGLRQEGMLVPTSKAREEQSAVTDALCWSRVTHIPLEWMSETEASTVPKVMHMISRASVHKNSQKTALEFSNCKSRPVRDFSLGCQGPLSTSVHQGGGSHQRTPSPCGPPQVTWLPICGNAGHRPESSYRYTSASAQDFFYHICLAEYKQWVDKNVRMKPIVLYNKYVVIIDWWKRKSGSLGPGPTSITERFVNWGTECSVPSLGLHTLALPISQYNARIVGGNKGQH